MKGLCVCLRSLGVCVGVPRVPGGASRVKLSAPARPVVGRWRWRTGDGRRRGLTTRAHARSPLDQSCQVKGVRPWHSLLPSSLPPSPVVTLL